MKVLLLIFLITFVYCEEDTKIIRARLESCPGCSLNRLKEVKQFVYEDVPHYDNVEFKKISGAPPELLFLNGQDEIVERHLLGRLTRAECNQLLQSKGFQKRDANKEL